MAKCPVCGMNVEERGATLKTVHMNRTYYFCSPNCKMEFDKNPHKYMESSHKHRSQGGCC